MQCLKHASGIDIPMFDKLTQLEISFGSYSWDLLANLLQRSHKLEVLVINKVCGVEMWILFYIFIFYLRTFRVLLQESQKYGKGQESRWSHPLLVPECLLHLKTFCLREYQGLETELDFVGYIMQNARVLETMTIYLSSSLSSEEKLQIRRHLSILQRNFETCQIVFHWIIFLKGMFLVGLCWEALLNYFSLSFFLFWLFVLEVPYPPPPSTLFYVYAWAFTINITWSIYVRK